MTTTSRTADFETNESVPWRSRLVQVVLASTLLAPLGVPLVSPALPVIRDAFGVTDATASLLVSAYFVAGIVLSPFVGALADRIGRKRVLAGSLVAFGLVGGATAFAPSFAVVLALRMVQGVAAAGIFVSTVTLVGDAFEGSQRNAVLGVNTAVLSTGAAAFPVVGGALVGYGWNAPFYAYLLAVPVGLVAAVVLDEPAREEVRSLPGVDYLRSALGAIAGSGTASFYAATFATEFLLFGAVFTALPFLLTAEYALTPLYVGVVITAAEAASVVASAANGRLSRSFSNGRLVAAGVGAYGVGLLGAWAAPSALFVGVSMLAVGCGVGLVLPSVDAAVSDRIPASFRAGALSLRNSTTFLGRASGPFVFAGLALVVGYPALLFASGTVALVGALVVGVVDLSRRGRATGTGRESPR
ncbi:Predicted arabinose efflux permease, MFS family [Halogranum amylolyticum]|uniref:Predicted arabinose efflux permease, MFS family n=1 Tax=Halogranum amylolyticum TaxID=660520 RepID=A0A1H8S3K8_9EURY|nr:MFS transporter [Halogranum amylolyticum]SEO73281.1 Predicted arabinose efflux permease, MFS family [Halogranum amylolyticum]